MYNKRQLYYRHFIPVFRLQNNHGNYKFEHKDSKGYFVPKTVSNTGFKNVSYTYIDKK